MALETVRIRDRFDIALAEVVRLAQQGYALKPLSAKMVGIVMYAEMEINSDQKKTGETAKADTKEVKADEKSENTDKPADTAPVTAKVTTGRKTAKKDA